MAVVHDFLRECAGEEEREGEDGEWVHDYHYKRIKSDKLHLKYWAHLKK